MIQTDNITSTLTH